MYIARAFAQQAQFFAAIAQAASTLPIVSIIPTLGTDWYGEPAVFFRVIVPDGIPPRKLLELANRVSRAILEQAQPLEEWGVLPYFDYSTESEAATKEPAPA